MYFVVSLKINLNFFRTIHESENVYKKPAEILQSFTELLFFRQYSENKISSIFSIDNLSNYIYKSFEDSMNSSKKSFEVL